MILSSQSVKNILLSHTIQIKAYEQYFQVVMFIMVLKMIVTFTGALCYLSLILGFHVTSEKTKIKLKLKILSFYHYGVKGIFKRISAGLSSAR